MTRQEICPNCRSVYEINGALDFGAKSIQVVNCPVCSQEKWIASGLWPQRWTIGNVIKREVVTTPPVIIPPPEDPAPVFSDFRLPGQDQAAALGQGLYKIGIWVVVVLVLIFLIKGGTWLPQTD